MNDVTGMPQSAVVIGGGSEIAAATLELLCARRLRRVVLIGRSGETMTDVAEKLRAAGAEEVTIELMDVVEIERASEVAARAAEHLGTIDCVFVAAGFLGDSDLEVIDAGIVARTITTNFTGPAALIAAFAHLLMRQGAGRFVVLSSVAGVRARAANFVYGSAKAGLDAFSQGLGDALRGSGVSMLIVRPGFVHTKMTLGMRPAPFATTPAVVAQATVRALEAGEEIVWVPKVLRYFFALLIHLPRPIWRLLPG